MANISFEKAVEIALEQHQAGHFERAEKLYMEILRQDPGNVDAMHLLGVLAHQGHQPEMAVELISAALSRRPDTALFHYNLAEALLAAGRREEALNSYNKTIELDPTYFEAHNNLGNMLVEFKRFDKAAVACRAAITIDPKVAAPYNNLGNALRGLQNFDEALASYQTAIELRPGFAEAFNNMAMCLCTMDRVEEAVESFRKAVQLNPASGDLHNNLGAALLNLGKIEEAAASFQTAIDVNPKHYQAQNNLGATLRALGKSEAAIPFFQKAIELKPDFAEPHGNLAAVYNDLNRQAEALVEVDLLLQMRPLLVKERFVRGTLLRDLLRHDEAMVEFQRTLELAPQNTGALTAMGYARLERGELDEAMELLKKSISLDPDPQTHSNVLLTANYHPGYSQADLLALHQSWALLHEVPHIVKWRSHSNDRSPNRKLRIGYVSPDFRGHSVSYFLQPILENHNHDQFEIYAYAHLNNPDMQTWRIRANVDQWREIANRNLDDVAEGIRNDQIDILIELAGHTGNNALPLFARKPAPVQINMIGFPSTTGLKSIDYRVTDARCDPPGQTDAFNTETLLRLPNLFWCYRPPDGVPGVAPLPADLNGHLTFLSVNNFTKVTPEVQRLWATMLKAVPNSRLILQTSALASQQVLEKVKALFEAQGVDISRLDFRSWTDFPTYMQLLTDADFTLDPYPFNGGTTTCHSLWMGAPVITLAGDRHASRMGLSMMTAIGLPEFVAHTPEEYVQIAVRFANDLPRLREIRAGMRDRLKASPLLDAVGYTKNLEAAYRQVWRKWCETSSIEVK